MSRFKPRGRKDSVRPFGFKPKSKGNNNLKLFKPLPLFPPDGYEGDIELDNKPGDLFENNLNLEEESLDQLRDQFNPKLLGKRDSIISTQLSLEESESEAEYLDAITVKRPPRKTSRSSEHYTDLINPPSLSGDNTSGSDHTDQRLTIIPPESSSGSDTMTEESNTKSLSRLVDNSPEPRVASPSDVRKSQPLSPITEEKKMSRNTPKPLGPVKPLSPTPRSLDQAKELKPTPAPPLQPKTSVIAPIPAATQPLAAIPAIPAIPAVSPIPPKVVSPTPKSKSPTPAVATSPTKEPEKAAEVVRESEIPIQPPPSPAATAKETLLISPSPVPKGTPSPQKAKTSKPKTSSPAATSKEASPTEIKSSTPKPKSPASKTDPPKALSPVNVDTNELKKPSTPKDRPKSGKKELGVIATEATEETVLTKVEASRPKSAKLTTIPDIPQLDVLTQDTVPRIATPTGDRPLSGKSASDPSIPKTEDVVPRALDIKGQVFPKADVEKKSLKVNAIPSISSKETTPLDDTKDNSQKLSPMYTNKTVDSTKSNEINDEKAFKEPTVKEVAALSQTKDVRVKESNYIDSTATREPPNVAEGHVFKTKSEIPLILNVERKTLPQGTDPVVLEQEAEVINQETLLIEQEIARLQQVQERGSRPNSGKKDKQILAQEISIIETEQEIARLEVVLQGSAEMKETKPVPVAVPVKSEKKEKVVRSNSVTSKASSEAGSTKLKKAQKPAERKVSNPKRPETKKKSDDTKSKAAEKKKVGAKPKKPADKPKQPTITRTNLKPSKEELEKLDAEEVEKTKEPEPEAATKPQIPAEAPAEEATMTKATIEDKSNAYLKFPEGPLDGGISEINFRRSLDYDEGDLANMYAQYYSSKGKEVDPPRPKSSGCCSVKREQVITQRCVFINSIYWFFTHKRKHFSSDMPGLHFFLLYKNNVFTLHMVTENSGTF